MNRRVPGLPFSSGRPQAGSLRSNAAGATSISKPSIARCCLAWSCRSRMGRLSVVRELRAGGCNLADVHRTTRPGTGSETRDAVRLVWHGTETGGGNETVVPSTGGVVAVATTDDGITTILRPPGEGPRLLVGVGGRRSLGAVLAPGTWPAVDRVVALLTDEFGQGGTVDRVDVDRVADRLGEVIGVGRDLTPLVRDVESALRSGVGVGRLCEDLGIDRRALTDLFVRRYGLGLKRYQRLCRFERALDLLRRADAEPLATVAQAAGYADQSHMSRELRTLAGWSPGRLHRNGGPSPVHIAHDETFKTPAA